MDFISVIGGFSHSLIALFATTNRPIKLNEKILLKAAQANVVKNNKSTAVREKVHIKHLLT